MHLKKSLWSEPVFGDNYYKNELSHRGGYSIQNRDAKYFEHYTRLYGMEAPLKILYAGCGICCLGDLIAYMGNEVLAIDISGYAIRYVLERQNTGDLFWHCFEWRFRLGTKSGIPEEVSYHDRKDYLHNVYVPSLYKIRWIM